MGCAPLCVALGASPTRPSASQSYFMWKAAISSPRGKVAALGITGVLQAEGAALICYLGFRVALFVEIL